MMDPTAYLTVALITLLPWIELRGAIPVGIFVLGLDPLIVFALSTTVNVLVFFPLFYGLTWCYKYFERFSFAKRIVGGARKKGEKAMSEYGFLGLAVFVAIPLPFTGAWMGTLIAWLFNLQKRRAFLAIGSGVVVAGVWVTFLCLSAKELLGLFFITQ